MSDGSNTEILEGIAEGSQVVTETIVKSEMPEMAAGEMVVNRIRSCQALREETKRKINKEQP